MIGNHNNYDYLFKFIVVGDSSVGKSCVILRYTQLYFKNEHEPTLGVEFASKMIDLQQLTIKTQIWDTAGQESFKAITRSYYKGSIAAFLIYDVTCRASFDNLHKWLYEIKNHSHDKVEISLLANKIDLKSKRQVTFQEGQTFAKNNNMTYFQISALSGDGVNQAFLNMTENILKKVLSKELNTDSETSLGVRKGKKQKKQIITRVSSGFDQQKNLDKKSNCCK